MCSKDSITKDCQSLAHYLIKMKFKILLTNQYLPQNFLGWIKLLLDLYWLNLYIALYICLVTIYQLNRILRFKKISFYGRNIISLRLLIFLGGLQFADLYICYDSEIGSKLKYVLHVDISSKPCWMPKTTEALTQF